MKEYYVPEAWIPHIALAHFDLDVQSLPFALQNLACVLLS